MKTRSIAVALLVSLAPVVLPVHVRVAGAQSDDASTKLARTRFQEGVAFFDKGQFELARASFLQAYALRKHPAVLLNLAQSSLKSGHTVEAARYFQQFLREHSSATAAQRSDAERGLREARARLGRIEIIGAPTGAEIYIDEERVGIAPLDAVDVEPGTHNVKARSRTDEVVQVTAGGGQLVAARFGAAAAPVAVPPPPPPVASSPPPAAAPESPPPAASETPPEEPIVTPPVTATSSEGGSHFFPSTMAPMYISGVLALAGFGTAIGMAVAKSSAQNSADSVAQAIRQAGGVAGQCISTSPNYARFANACAALSDDNSKVNTDAKIANVGLGVGLAATAFFALYWVFASKDGGASSTSASQDTRPVLSPMVGRGVGGLELGGRF